MSESAIDRRLRRGQLVRLHPRVYGVGHDAISRDGEWLAAVLAYEPHAALSHRSAAALWRLFEPNPVIEVTTRRKTRGSGSIRRHRARLDANEVTARRVIPVTTLTRTLLDVAGILPVDALARVVREAEFKHGLPVDLESFLDWRRGWRGAARLRTCIDRLREGPRGRSRSRLEDSFAALLGETDLRRPVMNAALDLGVAKLEADCLWRAQRLIVELDGLKAHGTRSALESDRERDRRLQTAGWRVIRVTWRQLDAPEALLKDLRRLLGDESASTVA